MNYLISSGDIKLISNDSLKYLLTNWKDLTGNLLENEQILRDVGMFFGSHRSKHVYNKNSYNWSDWDDASSIKNFEKVIADIEYRNLLTGLENAMPHVIQACNEVLESLTKIQELINLEISKLE